MLNVVGPQFSVAQINAIFLLKQTNKIHNLWKLDFRFLVSLCSVGYSVRFSVLVKSTSGPSQQGGYESNSAVCLED